MRDLREVADWLDCAHFVIRIHDADEYCVIGNRAFDIGRMQTPEIVNGDERDLDAELFLQLMAGFENRFVFDPGDDDFWRVSGAGNSARTSAHSYPRTTQACRERDPAQCEIVRFGSARSKNDFIFVRPE